MPMEMEMSDEQIHTMAMALVAEGSRSSNGKGTSEEHDAMEPPELGRQAHEHGDARSEETKTTTGRLFFLT